MFLPEILYPHIPGAEDFSVAKRLAGRYAHATPAQLDVNNAEALERAVAEHHVVVSLVPAGLHPQVARACIKRGVHMVTTSYISPEMEGLHQRCVCPQYLCLLFL
jgi:alpha-aminoadipic semialdehyde synthase